jgi:GTPase SAR1 family protein
VAPATSDTPDPIAYTRLVVGHASYHAQQQGRPDLVQRLETIQSSLADGLMTIAVVVGLTDAGKTTLVNECVGRSLLPIDLVRPTAVSTLVSVGDGAMTAHGRDDESPTTRAIQDANELRSVLSGAARDVGLARVTCQQWPRAVGLALLDTPSWSLANTLQRSAIFATTPNLVVLVSDAGQELSQAELTVLSMAARRGMPAVVVLTKTDMHPHWERIKAVDEAHLMRAGLRVPVLPVGLRLAELGRSSGRGDLVAESGVGTLITFLDQAATGQRDIAACDFALDVVTEALNDLTASLRTQVGILSEAEKDSVTTTERLQLDDRIRRLRSTQSTWRNELEKRYQVLSVANRVAVQTALRRIEKAAAAELDAAIPKDMWEEFAPRFLREVERELEGVLDSVERAVNALESEMAGLLGASGLKDRVSLGIEPTGARSSEDSLLATHDNFGVTGGGMFINVLRGAVPGTSIAGILGHYVGLSLGIAATGVLLPFGAALTLALGRHTYRTVKKAELSSQRAVAKNSVRQYIESIISATSEQLQVRLVTVRYELIDRFEQMTTTVALQVQAEATITLVSESERGAKGQELTQALQLIEQVAAHVPGVRALLANQAQR